MKPAVGFTLPSAGVTPAPSDKKSRNAEDDISLSGFGWKAADCVKSRCSESTAFCRSHSAGKESNIRARLAPRIAANCQEVLMDSADAKIAGGGATTAA